MTSRRIPKVDRPETLRQAQTWEANKSRWLSAGLCHTCAAQAAWGHQVGFSHVAPPCPSCVDGWVPERAGDRAESWIKGRPA